MYCLLHCLQVNIYTTLLTRQLMFSGPLYVQPVVVHVIEVEVFNSWHHLQLGVTHLLRRSFLSELVSTGWLVQGYLVGFGFYGMPAWVCLGIVLCILAIYAKYASFSWWFSSSLGWAGCKSGQVVSDYFFLVEAVCHVLDRGDLSAWLFRRPSGWRHPGSHDRHSVFSYLRHVFRSQRLLCNCVWCGEIGHITRIASWGPDRRKWLFSEVRGGIWTPHSPVLIKISADKRPLNQLTVKNFFFSLIIKTFCH